MLAAARKDLGLSGRPNRITKDYASRNGSVFLRAPWCAMSVTEWARDSGNAEAVLPEGDRAYTVWFAQDGKDLGRWHAGTATNLKKYAKPGDIIFFDWDGTDTISRIDHVGIVEVNLGDGRVQTIEGNTGDACKRRVRSASVIAGFWSPPYSPDVKPKPEENWTEVAVNKLPLLKPGAKGWHVKTLVHLLAARDHAVAEGIDDTVYSPPVVEKVKAFQKSVGLDDDSEVGPLTWAKLLRV